MKQYQRLFPSMKMTKKKKMSGKREKKILLTKIRLPKKPAVLKKRIPRLCLKKRHLKKYHLKRPAIICIPLLMTPILTKKSLTETSSVHSNTPPILLNH